MNLIINTWEHLMGNPNYLPDTAITLEPRDMTLPDGEVVKGHYRFVPEDNIAYICELAISLENSWRPGIEIIYKPGSRTDEMLLSMLASTAETLNHPIYLTLKTKLFATDEEE